MKSWSVDLLWQRFYLFRSCHCFPSDSFSPQPLQQLVSIQIKSWQKSARRLFTATFPLGAEPRVPALIRQQFNNSSGWSSQPWQKRYILQNCRPPGAPSVTELLPAAPATNSNEGAAKSWVIQGFTHSSSVLCLYGSVGRSYFHFSSLSTLLFQTAGLDQV